VSWAGLIMAGVAGIAALSGAIILLRRPRTPQGTYGQRIAATMLLAFALILALFSWGLERVIG
jgi:hypothetical protein